MSTLNFPSSPRVFPGIKRHPRMWYDVSRSALPHTCSARSGPLGPGAGCQDNDPEVGTKEDANAEGLETWLTSRSSIQSLSVRQTVLWAELLSLNESWSLSPSTCPSVRSLIVLALDISKAEVKMLFCQHIKGGWRD